MNVNVNSRRQRWIIAMLSTSRSTNRRGRHVTSSHGHERFGRACVRACVLCFPFYFGFGRCCEAKAPAVWRRSRLWHVGCAGIAWERTSSWWQLPRGRRRLAQSLDNNGLHVVDESLAISARANGSGQASSLLRTITSSSRVCPTCTIEGTVG